MIQALVESDGDRHSFMKIDIDKIIFHGMAYPSSGLDHVSLYTIVCSNVLIYHFVAGFCKSSLSFAGLMLFVAGCVLLLVKTDERVKAKGLTNSVILFKISLQYSI